MNLIKIKDGKNCIRLPTEKNTISLKTIKNYFPQASGLIYFNTKDEKCGVQLIENDFFKLVDGVDQYEIFNSSVINIPSKHPDNKSNIKMKRINEIMDVINKEEKFFPAKNSEVKKASNKIVVNKKNRKIINIGWKHKQDENGKFFHTKEPIAGAKTLELDQNISYHLKDIRNMIVEAIKTEENSKYFEGSIVDIGNYNEEVYDAFRVHEDENFWDFAKECRGNNSTLRLYLLTTKKSLSKQNGANNVNDEHSPPVNQTSSVVHIQDKRASPLKIIEPNSRKNVNEKQNLPSAFNLSNKQSIRLISKNDAYKSSKIVITTKGESENNKFPTGTSMSDQYKIPFTFEKNSFVKTNFRIQNDSKRNHISTATELSLRKKRLATENKTAPSVNSDCKTDSSEQEAIHDIDVSVPVIEEKDIHFSEIVLGKGSFGTVRRATWLKTDVAVKTIQSTSNDKYIIREIKIMDKIRHPNIVSIMAVSFTQYEYHIVLEYFNGASLRSVLFDNESKLNLKLTEENKSLICSQICIAIVFLHESKPTILHKDIKPDNILVNKEYQVKVCDLGIGTFDELPSVLHTTIGHNFQGTPLYMAPEILINNRKATIYSDVWSIACVIVELYSEKTVWNMPYGSGKNLKNLKAIIITLKFPNLSSIPRYLKDILKQCFQHEPERRPQASALLHIFKARIEAKE
ncbi:proto-oncogene tyrosine-protein kinase Src-like isoform X2 [Leptopilina boulardi]|uniref:proto-oncogene tyrosine-protein kinase Src-like isoform X2 n=1 Tax=Leptopilina boulardi TaxID=63433 RepID=UPI0021F5560E|nr:proto-oncogene tyrosine-protein kinase Src-like isoform X2 [Leptopilina boulardi]